MILSRLTWQDVESLSREVTFLVPTGSLEQHGPHLPLFTDSLIATAVAEGVERNLSEQVVLTPTLWMGASGHHLAFPGTISASFETYEGAIVSLVESLLPHGFRKFYFLNGHGGNTEPNGVALRKLKARFPAGLFGHLGYFSLIEDAIAGVLEGPAKDMRHACEAEASLIMHLHPDLVRTDKLRDDGLRTEPPVKGAVLHFDEFTEEGSLGYATLATSAKGRTIYEAAVQACTTEIERFGGGFVLVGIDPRSQTVST
ncbi:MAG: creatinine amidohydrolase [Fimbriimonadaceae bacterium]|jgi:creatinine amidohydrolase|nr:creatinine amidohydrolase [Fimbriimonadaceae bacterium]